MHLIEKKIKHLTWFFFYILTYLFNAKPRNIRYMLSGLHWNKKGVECNTSKLVIIFLSTTTETTTGVVLFFLPGYRNVGAARLFKMGLLVYILLFIYGSRIDAFGNYFSFNSLLYCSKITKKEKNKQFMCIWYNLLGTVRHTGFTSCNNSLRRKYIF